MNELVLRRTRVEVWSRVMGYYRPVAMYNDGKKAEFYSRKCFKEPETYNEDFNQAYS